MTVLELFNFRSNSMLSECHCVSNRTDDDKRMRRDEALQVLKDFIPGNYVLYVPYQVMKDFIPGNYILYVPYQVLKDFVPVKL